MTKEVMAKMRTSIMTTVAKKMMKSQMMVKGGFLIRSTRKSHLDASYLFKKTKAVKLSEDNNSDDFPEEGGNGNIHDASSILTRINVVTSVFIEQIQLCF